MVTSNVPVLDTPLELVRVLRVVGDISNSVDVLVSLDSEVLVDGDSSVLLELESGLFQVLCGWRDSSTHDDEVGGKSILALERDRAAVALVRFFRQLAAKLSEAGELTSGNNFLNSSLHDELDALFLHVLPLDWVASPNCRTHLHDGFADVLAQDSFEWDLVHSDQSHALWLLLDQGGSNLHSDEAGSDDDNVRVLRHGRVNRLGVFDVTKRHDTLEIGTIDGDLAGLTTCGEDEVIVLDVGA